MARSDRIAVVVVHGMGNQFPMDTLRGFVESLQEDGAILYSSPNRITEDREVRRLSFSRKPWDFFEYYWAHEMEEPKLSAILWWSVQLLFLKKKSNTLKKHIGKVYLLLLLILLLVGGLAALGYYLFRDQIEGALAYSVYSLSVLVLLKFIWSILSATIVGSIQSSIGDVIKYTIPSPDNIAVRDRIRKNGIELLKKLHEAKRTDGITPRYEKIILVGHSLGSIVAYDILNSLFTQYHTAFENIPAEFKQEALEKLLEAQDKPDHTNNDYQNRQDALFEEYRKLGNGWRIHQFITMGSPLTHASMLLNRKPEDFARKKQQREFPTVPPQIDHEDKHFAFNLDYKNGQGNPVTIKTLHHAAVFAVTQWTNVYYSNDWIGGAMAPEFGAGVRDVELCAGNKWLRTVPMATHTRYWNKKEPGGLNEIRELLKRSK